MFYCRTPLLLCCSIRAPNCSARLRGTSPKPCHLVADEIIEIPRNFLHVRIMRIIYVLRNGV